MQRWVRFVQPCGKSTAYTKNPPFDFPIDFCRKFFMQRTILVLFAVLSVISFNAYAAAQARSGKANRIEDRVIIQRCRIVLIRSPELARQFPERRSAVVIYPVISGLN